MIAHSANSSACAVMREMARLLAGIYATPRQATVAVAADPAHAMELLAAGRPGGAAVVMFYLSDADAADGDLPEDTRVEGRIRIGVVRHQGLAAQPAVGVPGALEEAEALRTCMARIVADETLTGGYEYAGMTYLQNNKGELLHGYALDYKALYAYTV